MTKHEKPKANLIFAVIIVIIAIAVLFQEARLYQINNAIKGIKSEQEIIASSLSESTRQTTELDNKISALLLELRNLTTQTSDNLEKLKDKIVEVKEESQTNIETLKEDLENLDSDFSSFVEELYPAVVSIQTNKAQGSGFLIRENGYLVTNAHVIKGATKLYAITHDGRSHDAFLVGSSDTYDIAVLKIKGNNYPYLEFEDQNNIKPGQKVIAIGNPLGLSFSISQGIISALDRQFKGSLINFIQTDTPINPGNSGGPVINSNRKVVGVATGIIRGGNDLGFAIPSDQAQQIIDNII